MKFRIIVRKQGVPDETRVVEAPSRFAVYSDVEKEGATVVTLKEGGGLILPHWTAITFGSGVKTVQLIVMTKNLAAMLSAGLSLSRALSVVERQAPKRLKAVALSLEESVKKGSSFHDALAEHSKVFSKLFIAMVRAGEESGSLAGSLAIIATQMEKTHALVRKIRGAMIYPTIVITAIIIVAVLMLIFVVPTLTATFQQLGVKVPLATRIITGTSNFMVANVFLVLGVLALLSVGGFFFVRSKFGSGVVLWCALHTPVVGELVRETYTARASRTLASLLGSGVPVLDALAIANEVVGAESFAAVIEEAEARVRKGEPISSAFAEHPKLYPPLMSDMLAVGEETGKLSEMLKQVAEFYEEDVEQKTKDLSTIIEPVLMLFIGAVVGIFAVSMIEPIYSLSSSL